MEVDSQAREAAVEEKGLGPAAPLGLPVRRLGPAAADVESAFAEPPDIDAFEFDGTRFEMGECDDDDVFGHGEDMGAAAYL